MVFRGELGWMSGTRSTLRNTGVQINAWKVAWSALVGFVPRYSPPGTSDAPDQVDRALSAENLKETTFSNRNQTFWTVQFPRDIRLAVGGFSSTHPGGAQFGQGDGSVQFESETIDPVVYRRMADRGDGALPPRHGGF